MEMDQRTKLDERWIRAQRESFGLCEVEECKMELTWGRGEGRLRLGIRYPVPGDGSGDGKVTAAWTMRLSRAQGSTCQLQAASWGELFRRQSLVIGWC
jgi:hypothetical protein